MMLSLCKNCMYKKYLSFKSSINSKNLSYYIEAIACILLTIKMLQLVQIAKSLYALSQYSQNKIAKCKLELS